MTYQLKDVYSVLSELKNVSSLGFWLEQFYYAILVTAIFC